ncbi:hypothetical protein Asphe3_03860 [Pseudarthrobacter phenanthrenivorans Sphe3]|uniref:Uncharacterized protein n=1 Tax=Pseudarthrobacter phenanthrenivorans (strain DSM 18606 / JCM 16027 / LMG 23796 / Sphe3) TaxID=930171 RepID=F0M8Q8_PSEPM|nr:hypothetical protein Asphe3_03860 [Pseudarthrobacter phenanthrenivorans Sphe3]
MLIDSLRQSITVLGWQASRTGAVVPDVLFRSVAAQGDVLQPDLAEVQAVRLDHRAGQVLLVRCIHRCILPLERLSPQEFGAAKLLDGWKVETLSGQDHRYGPKAISRM